MQSVTILRESNIVRTPRLMQMEGLFDVAPSARSTEKWEINLQLPESWNVGLIVGPSGCGKSTIARELFGKHMISSWNWPDDKSILDGFPAQMGIKDIVDLLSSVGFSSPPSWVRPFHVLSNGEQFRVSMARTLAESPDMAVVDEFTSVVDRTVAKIGSAAIAKTVRRRNQKFIAVACHYDIAEWLEPDWIYEPATDTLTVGRLLHRPKINLEIKRVHSSAWQLFRKHHYLDTNLHKSARCFVAFSEGTPVAFASVLHFPHPKSLNMKREHRAVCLPDYQGVGIGNALSAYVASIVKGLGCRYVSITSHPAMMRARARSPLWKMIAAPNAKTKSIPRESFSRDGVGSGKTIGFTARFRATFEYVGPAMNKTQALMLWQG
jgi:ABC-type molybdenum transport system ATPase subunit/photorepair protein PhrA